MGTGAPRALAFFALLVLAAGTWPQAVSGGSLGTAVNQSSTTLCAEEDNLDVRLVSPVRSFVLEATHPAYDVGTDNCAADFRDCPAPVPGFPFQPGVWKLWDDGVTVVEAVRQAEWWRPNGMRASVDAAPALSDVHYLRVSRNIVGTTEFPQFFVIYMDGNVRLIPLPPVGRLLVCFGSSVVVGPAAPAPRPIAEIASVHYRTADRVLEAVYAGGGSATFDLNDVDRLRARVKVEVRYPTTDSVATLRSMYVAEGNADVDHVLWANSAGAVHLDAVLNFPGGAGRDWLFLRADRSIHNTSAPDLQVLLGGYFDDVVEGHPFFTYVNRIRELGITGGCSASPPLYCPDEPVTRGQMAVFLIRALGETPDWSLPAPFQDVPDTHPFYGYIKRLFQLGITGGCSTSPALFCPDASVTRGQMAVFLIRALGETADASPPSPFQDVPESHPFYGYIKRLLQLGITGGCSASPVLYCPDTAVTRGQMAVFLVRAFDPAQPQAR